LDEVFEMDFVARKRKFEGLANQRKSIETETETEQRKEKMTMTERENPTFLPEVLYTHI